MINPFEEIKNRLTIEEVAERLDIKLSIHNTTKCPFSDHLETTGSFKIFPETNSFYCFGCCRGGDMITLVKLFFNFSSNKEAAEYLSKNFNLDLFEKKLTLKLKKKIQKAIEEKENCEFNINFLERWKKEKDNILSTYFKALEEIAKIPKLPEDENSEIFAFAKSELQNMTEPNKERWSRIEDMLEFLRCGTDFEILKRHKDINFFIKNLEKRWDNTKRSSSKNEL